MDAELLRQVEDRAVGLARGAGEILHRHFRHPLAVEYKGEGKANPVTPADRDVEEYLRQGISDAFPHHGVLGEEGAELSPQGDDLLWAIDPLDGTTNFLNGLPFYAVSLGVLQAGRPVVGAIFVPAGLGTEGNVFHARRGGGACCDGQPIRVAENTEPEPQRLTAVPGAFGAQFRIKGRLRRRLGEGRVAGSIAYELALTAAGTFQYAVFGGPRVWDAAAGVVLVEEAGGLVLVRTRGGWQPLESFTALLPGKKGWLEELKEWRGSLVAGNPPLARLVASQLGRPWFLRYRLMRLFRRLGGQRRKGEKPRHE